MLGSQAASYAGLVIDPSEAHVGILHCSARGPSCFPSSVGQKAFQALPAMVFTVQTFLAEMVATEELVKARNGQDPSFLQAMGTQLQHKLDHMAALSHQDAVVLFQALANSQLPEEVTTTLTKTVETKLIQGGGNQASKTTMQAQELEHLQNYLTPSDWAKLEDTTMFQGVDTVVARLRSLGCTNAKECTKKATVGLLLLAMHLQKSPKMPPYSTIYELSNHFGQMLSSSTVHVPDGVPSLQVYPQHPSALGQSMLQKIYGAEMPEARLLERLPLLLAHHIPVRSSSKAPCMTQVPKTSSPSSRSSSSHSCSWHSCSSHS